MVNPSQSMAENHSAADNEQSPEIIVLGPPAVFREYDKEFCSRFRVLKPWESPLPLLEFLAGRAKNTLAALCAGYFSLSAAVLSHLPSLRVVVTTSAGLDHIDFIECRRRGVAVANAPNIFSADVADCAVGLLLDVCRKISAGNRFVKDGLWPAQGEYPLGFKFGDKRVGIVGLGSIGLEVVKRLEAFGCAISYHSRNRKTSVSYVFYPDICELAATSDILVICCALTEETHHMINREVMLALGKDGVIVNIARGAVIDEKELVSCLQRGEIAGAGLDVFENEPHIREELFELDNVVVSSHTAASTEESFRECYELMAGNLEAFFSNKPLLTPVPEEY